MLRFILLLEKREGKGGLIYFLNAVPLRRDDLISYRQRTYNFFYVTGYDPAAWSPSALSVRTYS